jgi:hypothetical protein
MSAIISPALLQAPVEPIPENIEDKLRRPASGIVGWSANTDVRQNVLTFTQRELHLRHEVQIRFGAGCKVPIGKKFHHRRPDAPEPPTLDERFADRRMDENSLGSFPGIGGQVRAGHQLKETEPGQPLAEGGKCAESRHAGAETLRPVACGEVGFTLKAQYRAAPAAAKQHSLVPENEISDAADPAPVLALNEAERS